MIWLALACLGGLAVTEALAIGTTWLRTVLIIGIVLAGTGAMIAQADRRCPRCGARYGYRFRLIHANRCWRCGADLPSQPGGAA